MNSSKGYTLAKGVQVRKEIFGLLFYDYRGPRLYFVPSKDLVTETFFDGNQSINQLSDRMAASSKQPKKLIQEQIKHLVELLEGKGLVYGQSIR